MISPNIILPSVSWSASALAPSLHRPKLSGPVHCSTLKRLTRFPRITFCVLSFDPFARRRKIRRSSSGTFMQLHLTSCLLGQNSLLSTLVSLSTSQYEIPSSEAYMKSSKNYSYKFLSGLHHYIFRYLRGRDRVMNPPQQLYILLLNNINPSTF
jgi:hypothetical protein